jgi:cullin 3
MFELSFYQMCILMCFNSNTCLTIQDIESLTAIPKSEFNRHFHGLTTTKLPLIIPVSSKDSNSSSLPSLSQDNASSSSSSSSPSPPSSSSSSSFSAEPELYCVNRAFNSKRKMLSVPLLESKKSDISGSKTDGTSGSGLVENVRVLLVDSVIVRILKARKTIQFPDLLAECSRQLSSRFLLDVQILKQRLENLIEREYIVRDDKDGKIFHYFS